MACRTSPRRCRRPTRSHSSTSLSAAGPPVIEVSAFVSPKWVPQMADAAEVFAGITRRPGVRYTALVPNLAGLERAHARGCHRGRHLCGGVGDIQPQEHQPDDRRVARRLRAVCERAASLGVRVRAYVSTAFGCPFEGHVPPERVAAVSHALIEMGAFEVSVSDTIGVAHPGQVPVVVGAVAARVPLDEDRAPLSRHARHRPRQRPDRARSGRDDVRRVGRRPGRLPVCARGDRQPGDRRSGLHARRSRDRDRRESGRARRRVRVRRVADRAPPALALLSRGHGT